MSNTYFDLSVAKVDVRSSCEEIAKSAAQIDVSAGKDEWRDRAKSTCYVRTSIHGDLMVKELGIACNR